MMSTLLRKRHACALVRELGALIIALAVWSGLALLTIAFGWRPTSVWWYVLLPLYLPTPVAAFVYVLLVRPPTRKTSVKRASFLAALGWILTSPIPIYPLFAQFAGVFEFFHTVPTTGEAPLFGTFYASVVSSCTIGIFYCGYSGYWAGRLGSLVLQKRDSTGRTPPAED